MAACLSLPPRALATNAPVKHMTIAAMNATRVNLKGTVTIHLEVGNMIASSFLRIPLIGQHILVAERVRFQYPIYRMTNNFLWRMASGDTRHVILSARYGIL